MKEKILNFLKELRQSDCDWEHYRNGDCYNLYIMLKTLIPEVTPYYNPVIGHIVIEYKGSFFDISGEIIDSSHYRPFTSEDLGWTVSKYKQAIIDMYKTNPFSIKKRGSNNVV